MHHILIIDSNPAATTADRGVAPGAVYAAALRACRDDLTLSVIRPYDGDALPALEMFDGVVFTGSAVEWSTDDARAEPIAAVMRAVFRKGLPTLGSCNGMQLAASVLGGRSDASPNGQENGLARDIQLTQAGRSHPFLAGRVDGYAAPCIHRDEVSDLPEGAVVLAGNSHSGVQAFAYEQDGIRFWGVQYHPEYTPEVVSGIMSRTGFMGAQDAQDLSQADTSAEAAARLGIRPDDLAPEMRLTELRNWLAQL